MNAGKVAVPYYGKLHRDKFGYERIYFIVESGDDKESGPNVSLGVWDHEKQGSLPEWLKTNGVASLVCREDPEQNLKNVITDLGIEVLNGRNRDASRLMQSLLV